MRVTLNCRGLNFTGGRGFGMAIGEAPVSFEDYICDDGMGAGPFKIKCTMWREGEKCIFDFTGTDPQSISSINFLLNEEMFKMFAGVYMIMVFDPQILFNDGFYDLMEVRIPAGTLLKPLKPAALSCRTHALGRIFDILGGLLGQGNPAFMCAAGFSDSPHFMYSGYDKNGNWYQLYQITFGGIPGKPFGDGPDGGGVAILAGGPDRRRHGPGPGALRHRGRLRPARQLHRRAGSAARLCRHSGREQR